MAALSDCRLAGKTTSNIAKAFTSTRSTIASRSLSRKYALNRNCAATAHKPICSRRLSTAPRLSSQLRFYHSQFHPPLPTHEYTNSQTAILSAALKHIPDHGFTKQALMLGARDMGFLDVSIQLFSRQEMDLIVFWLASRRGLLRSKVENGLFEGKEQLGVDEKIKTLVLERLKMNNEIIHRWQDVRLEKKKKSEIPELSQN
jgi:ubiquinone biosynthesis protein COQ9